MLCWMNQKRGSPKWKKKLLQRKNNKKKSHIVKFSIDHSRRKRTYSSFRLLPSAPSSLFFFANPMLECASEEKVTAALRKGDNARRTHCFSANTYEYSLEARAWCEIHKFEHCQYIVWVNFEENLQNGTTPFHLIDLCTYSMTRIYRKIWLRACTYSLFLTF